MKKMLQRGFTLIELLVVIAIIGILAAVVLASLNDARDSGSDASAKTSMNNLRSQAEIFYNNNDFAYDDNTTENDASGVCGDDDVIALLEATEQQTANAPTCLESATSYAVEVDLRAENSWFCVDSTGYSGVTADSSIGAGDLECE